MKASSPTGFGAVSPTHATSEPEVCTGICTLKGTRRRLSRPSTVAPRSRPDELRGQVLRHGQWRRPGRIGHGARIGLHLEGPQHLRRGVLPALRHVDRVEGRAAARRQRHRIARKGRAHRHHRPPGGDRHARAHRHRLLARVALHRHGLRERLPLERRAAFFSIICTASTSDASVSNSSCSLAIEACGLPRSPSRKSPSVDPSPRGAWPRACGCRLEYSSTWPPGLEYFEIVPRRRPQVAARIA